MPLPAMLPLWLKPKACRSPVRMGRDFDGGYVVDKQSIMAADILLSFGVNDDWSFEKSVHDSKPAIAIFTYDGSISAPHLLLRAARNIFKPKRAMRRWRQFLAQLQLEKIARHSAVYIGKKRGHHSFSTIVASLPPSSTLFVKCDIEGSEYEILDEFIAHAARLSGLAIEFHDVDRHLDAIEHFVRNFALKVSHVHCNNFGPVNEAGCPSVIEVSFSAFCSDDPVNEPLPMALDQPNDRHKADYVIRFTDEPL